MDCHLFDPLAGWIHSQPDSRSILEPVYQSLCTVIPNHARVLITIDGPCGSGKSTLASLLSSLLAAPVIHTDDFMVPMAQKTTERLAIPGGNEDTERLAAECLDPWHQTGNCICRPFDCHGNSFLPSQKIEHAPILILEGSYSNLPILRKYANVRIFLDISYEVQLRRLEARVGREHLPMFRNRWIPLEQAYFDAYHLPDEGCIVLPAEQLPPL